MIDIIILQPINPLHTNRRRINLRLTNLRLKSQVTRSVMPTALGVDKYMIDPGAIGTIHFVTAEFIPMNYTANLTTASAVGTTDFVTWEFIPLPHLKTNEPCKK